MIFGTNHTENTIVPFEYIGIRYTFTYSTVFSVYLYIGAANDNNKNNDDSSTDCDWVRE